MTANKRIFLNIIATYGRSLYALVIGLFCGRWALMALGEVDYGLMGLVGGLTAFIVFFNGLLASGVGRFYAISVGRTKVDPVEGLEECRRWFTTAVLVHTLVPLVLMVIGYPIGEWAVRSFLTIPADRVGACVWVWRYVCVTCLIGMAGVPFSAMYTAKQEIAELTVYSFVTTTLNVIVLYYMLQHPGDWLAVYALWTCALSVVPQLIICSRAGIKYPECRFRVQYMHCWSRVRQMLAYSGWLTIGNLADMLSIQGMNVLINKYCGPRVNAAQSVGNNVASQCTTLSGSLIGAFWPVITSAYGAGDLQTVRTYVYRVSRIATFLILIFAIPLGLEVEEVLRIWLKNPPQYATGLCICALLVAAIDKTSYGYAIAVHATGRIAWYIAVVGVGLLLTLPIAWFLFVLGYGVYAAAGVVVLTRTWSSIARVYMARKLIEISFCHWLFRIFLPITLVSVCTLALGGLVRFMFPPSFGRIVMTTCVCEAVFVPMVLWLVLNGAERQFLYGRFAPKVRRLLTLMGRR